MQATARKSRGEYKPVIKYSSGRTKIVGQRGRVQRIVPQTKFYSGPTEVYRPERGVTFATRDEAVAYAQRVIDQSEQRHYQAALRRMAEGRCNPRIPRILRD